VEEVVKVESLTNAYGALPAIDHVSLSVKRGTAFGLLGANGAGKSTTIECILGTKLADSGNVSVLALDPRKDRRRLFQQVGVQFQECDYQPEIKVSELCEETSCLYKAPADWRELCEQFGIGDKTGSPVKSLSGGERQRISIARAFLKDAPIILLDEATASLDVENETLIQESLSKLIENKTVMIIAHRMRTVAGADKIVVLSDGAVAEQGSSDTLLKKDGIYARMVKLQTQSQNWAME